MASRGMRAQIAQQTVEIINAGHYIAPSGATISIAKSVQHAKGATQLFVPDDARLATVAIPTGRPTTFQVQNQTTFSAARRLVDQLGAASVAALNFASAKNPGGGFLGGSQAQEESLARASALYECLCTQRAYYDANRAHVSSLYTDYMIVSPRVTVFRDDDDRLLENPWEVTIITSPAPNAGAIGQNQPNDLWQIEGVLRRRIEMILSAAILLAQKAVVLGAWGCGVFRNDPAMVARLFREALYDGGRFTGAFEHIAFAVLDPKGDTVAAFRNAFRACL